MTVYTVDNLHKWAEKVETNVATLAKHIAFSAFEGVTQKSPVDTGRFKASWNIRQGKVDKSVKPEGKHKTSPRGQASSKPANVFNKTSKPYDPWYISNNLDYGPALENGHSNQAPTGMVKLTVIELKAFVRQEVRKLRDT